MRKTWMTRIVLAGAMAMAMVGLMASPASADNKSLGDSHGSFTFIDDGDMFEICDEKADGHGVIGRLVLVKAGIDGSFNYVLILDDGGDAGCDKQGFNIGNLHSYRLEYWWEGNKGDTFQATGWFNE
jgi:hypothetical protein